MLTEMIEGYNVLTLSIAYPAGILLACIIGSIALYKTVKVVCNRHVTSK